MNDKDLIALWQQDSLAEENIRSKNVGQYERIAQQKSADVFQRIKTNIYWEMPISAIVAVGFPFLFLGHWLFFWLSAVVMALALGYGIKVYNQYLADINGVNESALAESLQVKRSILAQYIHRLNVSLWIFAPMGLAIGLGFAMKQQEEITLIYVGLVVLLCIPVVALIIWGMRKYIHTLYGKHLAHIDSLLKDFSENNSGKM